MNEWEARERLQRKGQAIARLPLLQTERPWVTYAVRVRQPSWYDPRALAAYGVTDTFTRTSTCL